MLTEDQIKELKQELENKKKDLAEQLQEIAKKDDKVKDNYKTQFPNLGREDEDNAEEYSEYDRMVPLEHDLELELKEVNQALAKLEKGERYGMCENCGEEIMLERLKAIPETPLCIKCAKK